MLKKNGIFIERNFCIVFDKNIPEKYPLFNKDNFIKKESGFRPRFKTELR